MAIALVLNGVPELQDSVPDGLKCLQVLLIDRRNAGCTIMPIEAAKFGIEYKIQHPGSGTESVFLTDYPDPDNSDWDVARE